MKQCQSSSQSSINKINRTKQKTTNPVKGNNPVYTHKLLVLSGSVDVPYSQGIGDVLPQSA